MDNQILIVEDDFFSANILKKMLSIKGYESVIAENGQLALDELNRNENISICFLDLNMPVMDGYQFLEEISKIHVMDKLSVYITSCNSMEIFSKKISSETVNLELIKGFYQKPFDFNKLISTINP